MITLPRTVALTEGVSAVLNRPGTDFEPVTVDRLIGDTWALVSNPDREEPAHVRRDELATHTDYPHTPGYLIDCYACLLTCHCADGTCVHCEDEQGYASEELSSDPFEYDLTPDTDIFSGLDDH